MKYTERLALESNLIHTLIYGPSKSRKSWWSGTAAEAGYNVTFLHADREGGDKILSKLSPEAQNRITIIDIKDRLDRPVAAQFITRLCLGKPFLWDEDDKLIRFTQNKINPDHHHIWCDPTKLNANDVIIGDSWTGIVNSVAFQFDDENARQPSDAERIDWDGYGWSGRICTWYLRTMANFPCHLIVIGHQQMYEKKKTTKKINPKTGKSFFETVVEWSRLQPASTSGNHSQTLSDKFDDVLYFFFVGNKIMISSEPDEGRDGGSSIIPPNKFNWSELPFSKVCEYAKTKVNPELKAEAFTQFNPGDEIILDNLIPKLSLGKKEPPTALNTQSAPKVLKAVDAAKPNPKFALLGTMPLDKQ